jgi:hypothetical protein
MQLKADTRLHRAVDAREVVVVPAPSELVDLRCGGHPSRRVDEQATPDTVATGFGGSAQLGEAILEVNGAKPLPASD